MSEWTFKGKQITEQTQFPEQALGFVYLITCLITNKCYVGKKLLWFKKVSVKTVTDKKGVKKKKKTNSLVPSDWKTYWGSSNNVQADLEKYGPENFTREILMICQSKGSLSYYEARFQFDYRVLENPDRWYNGIINLRCAASHVKPLLDMKID